MPPIDLIVRQFTPSDNMCSNIIYKDREDDANATALRSNISLFFSHTTPSMDATRSPSRFIEPIESLVFSVSSPSARELINYGLKDQVWG